MKDVNKFSYLEALIATHNDLMIQLATQKLNVRVLTQKSIMTPTGNAQLEQNLLHFKGLVAKLTESIQVLTEMIREEEAVEKKYREKMEEKDMKN